MLRVTSRPRVHPGNIRQIVLGSTLVHAACTRIVLHEPWPSVCSARDNQMFFNLQTKSGLFAVAAMPYVLDRLAYGSYSSYALN